VKGAEQQLREHGVFLRWKIWKMEEEMREHPPKGKWEPRAKACARTKAHGADTGGSHPNHSERNQLHITSVQAKKTVFRHALTRA